MSKTSEVQQFQDFVCRQNSLQSKKGCKNCCMWKTENWV